MIPWIQRPLDSTNLHPTTLKFNNLEFNNPWIQPTWVQQSLDSTILGLSNLEFNTSRHFTKTKKRPHINYSQTKTELSMGQKTEVRGQSSSIIWVRGDFNACHTNPKYAGRLTVVPDYSRSIADVTDAMFHCFPVFNSCVTKVKGTVAIIWLRFPCIRD